MPERRAARLPWRIVASAERSVDAVACMAKEHLNHTKQPLRPLPLERESVGAAGLGSVVPTRDEAVALGDEINPHGFCLRRVGGPMQSSMLASLSRRPVKTTETTA
jgi:hypothetical protein